MMCVRANGVRGGEGGFSEQSGVKFSISSRVVVLVEFSLVFAPLM